MSAASLKKETIFNTFFHRSVTVVVNFIPNRATSQGDDKRLNDKDTKHTPLEFSIQFFLYLK